MSSSRANADIQLYYLLTKMSAFLEERELGLLTSYSILSGLYSFRTNSGSDTEKRFEQVKAVYTKLEEALSSCREDTYFHHLSDLMAEVDPLIKRYEEGELGKVEEVGGSELFNGTLQRLSSKFSRDYVDRLKRDGLALYHRVKVDGDQRRRVDALNGDYRAIDEVFVVGKK